MSNNLYKSLIFSLYSGAVFSASSPDGSPVAVKVNNLRGLPPAKSQRIVQTYLNEVALLERLRRESHHVVYIYDFDFEPSTGQCKNKYD